MKIFLEMADGKDGEYDVIMHSDGIIRVKDGGVWYMVNKLTLDNKRRIIKAFLKPEDVKKLLKMREDIKKEAV